MRLDVMPHCLGDAPPLLRSSGVDYAWEAGTDKGGVGGRHRAVVLAAGGGSARSGQRPCCWWNWPDYGDTAASLAGTRINTCGGPGSQLVGLSGAVPVRCAGCSPLPEQAPPPRWRPILRTRSEPDHVYTLTLLSSAPGHAVGPGDVAASRITTGFGGPTTAVQRKGLTLRLRGREVSRQRTRPGVPQHGTAMGGRPVGQALPVRDLRGDGWVRPTCVPTLRLGAVRALWRRSESGG